MNINNKKVLITGASSGIGQAAAIALAQKGAYVYASYNSNKTGAQQTLNEVQKHSNGEILQANLENKDEVQAMFEKIETIDTLVNNAGAANSSDIDDYDMWEHQWKNIFMSAVYCTNEFLKKNESNLRDKKIVNISSMYGNFDQCDPDFIQYSAAKAAMSNFTVAVAKKYGAQGLSANAVAPGWTETPPWKSVSEADKQSLTATTLLGGMLRPESIANGVVFLLETDGITGQIITIDNGLFPPTE